MISRRGFLQSVLALGVAPYIGKAAALMKSPTFGRRVPLIFGTVRMPGVVVACSDLRETVQTIAIDDAGNLASTYRYSASFDVVPADIYDGSFASVLDGVKKLWLDDRLIFDAATRAPPPFERSESGLLRFKDFPLTDYGNRIPAIAAEFER